MTELRQFGRLKSASTGTLSAGRFADLLGDVRSTGAIELGVSRDEASVVEIGEVDSTRDIIEIEFGNGIRLWQSVDAANEDFSGFRTAIEETHRVTLPAQLGIGSQQRGVLGWSIKTLKLLKIDPIHALARNTALQIAKLLENRLDPEPGLYSCDSTLNLGQKISEPTQSDEAPFLVLIHGTMSNTSGSFSALEIENSGKPWSYIRKHYGPNHILAFEHRTLTQSPISNALDLARALPIGAHLHFLTHSRGGLVAELFARAMRTNGAEPFDEEDFKFFEAAESSSGQDRKDDRNLLKALSLVLKEKKLRIERVVRVACPVRGTTMASKRLDRYLSLLINLLEWIPGFQENPVFDLVSSFLIAVARERTDPSSIPGLEAQMPESPLIRMLNRPGIMVDGQLAIVSGDIEGAGLLQGLLVLATDLFFTEDHDLVVNTEAMEGGAERLRSRILFDQSAEVNHFRYFANFRTANAVHGALTGDDHEAFGFQQEFKTAPRGLLRAVSGDAPKLFVIPAFMGSTLQVDGETIWPDHRILSRDGFGALAITRPNVSYGEIIPEFYGELIAQLSQSHNVVQFPYDWRKSLREEGLRLGRYLTEMLSKTDKPIRILAHSSGGLLFKAAIAQDRELWNQLKGRSGAMVVMLGLPNSGSYAMASQFLAQGSLVKVLAALEPTNNSKEVLNTLLAMPGFLEQLPADESLFVELGKWNARGDTQHPGWTMPSSNALEAARSSIALFATAQIDPVCMRYIAGQAGSTSSGIVVERSLSGSTNFKVTTSTHGDGRVLWESGIPPGVQTWYSSSAHGDLPHHAANIPAIQELLTRGTTGRLPRTPPVAPRNKDEPVTYLRDAPLSVFPNAKNLLDVAMGAMPVLRSRPPIEKISASIVHGNLAYAQHPVLVGHYVGDMFVGAEAYIDNILEGRLSRRRDFGLYPGPIGTSEVFIKKKESSFGAVIVGLGRYGELFSDALTSTVSSAVLRYALLSLEEGTVSAQTANLKICALLIGHRESRLTVRDSVFAILEGVIHANLVLSGQSKGPDKAKIVEIEFVEHYEDTAIEAADALSDAEDHPRYRDLLEVSPTISVGHGSRLRVDYGRERDWWQRIQISSSLGDERGSSLSFILHSDAAQADRILQNHQRTLVDEFIDSAVNSSARESEFGRTLYELLIPRELKNYAMDRRNLLLMLDEEAARYPWELLQDRLNRDGRPAAVRSSLIRQLVGTTRDKILNYATGNSAFVIGDPPSNFIPLPGAAQEATEVAALLVENGYTVVQCIRKSAGENIAALMLGNHKIVHLAGHGVYNYGEQRTSGMVLGKDIFLTPSEIAQLRPMPEFVFVNCCHLGKVEASSESDRAEWLNRHRLAANLGTQFIRQGVKAVVMAGWAVDDIAASRFAKAFYSSMLAGDNFGEAVLKARQETYEAHRGTNTWGAYQCYGDPDYRFRTVSVAGSKRGHHHRFYSPTQVIAAARNIVADAEPSAKGRYKFLNDELESLEQGLPMEWRSDSAVLSAIGLAYGELGRFDRAIDCMRQALDCSYSNVPVMAIEQLANFRIRQVFNALPVGPSGWDSSAVRAIEKGIKHKAIQEIRSAIDDLINLPGITRELTDGVVPRANAIGGNERSAERHILIGGGYKRLAQLQTGKSRLDSLASMEANYGVAYRLQLKDADKGDFMYPALNWLSSRILSWFLGHDDGALERDIETVSSFRARAVLRHESSPSFWNAIVIPESVLLEGLWSNTLRSRTDEIASAYALAHRRGCSQKQRLSVQENHRFMKLILSDKLPQPRRMERSMAYEQMTLLSEKVESILQSE